MNFVWQSDSYNWIVSLIFIVLFYALLYVMFAKIVKRNAGYVILSISFFFTLLSFLFNLMFSFIIVSVISGAMLLLFMFANLGDLRSFIANPFKVSRVKGNKVDVEKIYNRSDFYKVIESAVINLSKTRTGAIMTFVKSQSLDDVIKNGVIVKAPVTAELLTTIFYPGTRLHDGAVVIKDNMIVAASVFYTPTTKPFAGKYGSRHRAAIGISEITDAVTVIVSEETGRISFAVNGQLDVVTPDSFLRAFENYMEGIDK